MLLKLTFLFMQYIWHHPLQTVISLMAVITIHEFGHLAIGRLFGLKVEEFRLGLGHCYDFGTLNIWGHDFSDWGIIKIGVPITGKVTFVNNSAFSLHPIKQVCVFSAGAVFNLITGYLFSYLSPAFFVLSYLAILDLLPLWSLDGKRIYNIFFRKKPIYYYGCFYVFLVIVISALAASIILCINEAYMTNKGYKTLWEAKDALSFYGSFLAFLGTISLGALALWQNLRLYRTTSRNEKKRIAIEHHALFSFDKIKYTYFDKNGKQGINNQYIPVRGFNGDRIVWNTFSSEEHDLQLRFSIKNIGNSVATNIRVSNDNGSKMANTSIHHTENEENDLNYLARDVQGVLIIFIPRDTLHSNTILIYFLRYQNPFGSTFIQNIYVEKKNSVILIETQMILKIQEQV